MAQERALSEQIIGYLGGLTLAGGDHDGETFKVLPWDRRFIRGAFAKETEVRLEEQIQRADALDSELADAKDQIDVMERSGGDSAKGMVAKSDHETLNENYSKTFALLKKRDRKLNAIKRDLLNGQTADDVLGRHFGLTRI